MKMNEKLWIESFPIRLKFYHTADKWAENGVIEPLPFGKLHFLTELFGFENSDDFAANVTIEHLNIVKMMSGPNGWTIYKALLARKNNECTSRKIGDRLV